MAHRDLGDFYRAIGEQASSLKHYTKSREFCTTSHHVLEMCMSVLELLMEQRSYSHIGTYVFKAEAALDSATNVRQPAGPQAPAGAAQATREKRHAEREKVTSKLDVATAISHLGQGNYEKAAQSFLKVGPPKGLEDWFGKVRGAPTSLFLYLWMLTKCRAACVRAAADCPRRHRHLRDPLCACDVPSASDPLGGT